MVKVATIFNSPGTFCLNLPTCLKDTLYNLFHQHQVSSGGEWVVINIPG